MQVKNKGIRVHVVFEFDDIPDPDCDEASTVEELIRTATDNLADEFNASRCYVDDVTQTLWAC